VPVTLLPDVEAITSAYLRSNADVTGLVGQRVYTQMPKKPVENNLFPLVLISQFNDSLTAPPMPYWVTSRIQFSCYGGATKMAWTVATTIRVLLLTDFIGAHSGGVVTVSDASGLQDLPDASIGDSPQPRWIFDATITARPG
jgi:hypothetical protein